MWPFENIVIRRITKSNALLIEEIKILLEKRESNPIEKPTVYINPEVTIPENQTTIAYASPENWIEMFIWNETQPVEIFVELPHE